MPQIDRWSNNCHIKRKKDDSIRRDISSEHRNCLRKDSRKPQHPAVQTSNRQKSSWCLLLERAQSIIA